MTWARLGNFEARNKARFGRGSRIAVPWWSAAGDLTPRFGTLCWQNQDAAWVRVKLDDDYPDTSRTFAWHELRTEEEAAAEVRYFRQLDALRRLGGGYG